MLVKASSFFDFLITLIRFGYQQPDNQCVTIAIEAAKNLTGFFRDKRWEQKVVEAFRLNFMELGDSNGAALTNLMI
jgi:hypothetical protein